MHTRELIELAALVASHARPFIACTEEVSPEGIGQYWAASKCRLDRWSRSLKEYTSRIHRTQGSRSSSSWQRVRPVLEEILTGEVLTRVWTAVACAHDRRHAANQIEPVVRSVLVGHLEARSRALNLMVYGQGFGVDQAVALNRLRRRSERWTDMLLGTIADQYDVSELAFDVQRTRDFAGQLNTQQRDAPRGQAWPLVLTSLRAAFQQGLCPASPNADLNERIASGILGCFDAQLFDSTGLMKTTWLVRLAQTTSDTQGLIDQILFDGAAPPSTRPVDPSRRF